MVSMPHSKVELLMGLGFWGIILRNLRVTGRRRVVTAKRIATRRNSPMYP